MIVIKPISPVAVDLLGLEIRWYALAYVAAFIAGLWLVKKIRGLWFITKDETGAAVRRKYDDLLSYAILGVIIGGRLGYVFFYNPLFFMYYPSEIFMIWRGGMSFHGGMLGVIVAALLLGRRYAKHAPWRAGISILDSLAVVAPIGLFFGRVANFINMELMGRITDGPLGVAFEGITTTPRHPSPLYEAATEGLILFAVMMALRRRLRDKIGALSGVFAILYGAFRIFCEHFREPDAQLGYLFGTEWLTMGMFLSVMMIAAGTALIFISRPVAAGIGFPRRS